ncbi:MAG: MerR family transcriptional regulator [Dehalococcoidia bacterium]|jgi:MerR family transcriptional regulator/heat shock protein HspR|nr:MerR family transcriptional regulator [Dehalococcoidia bacterium]|tara:strand:+ start:178 stop:504 length:327 start_codon:yes stop_codon:yes gene_type:complete
MTMGHNDPVFAIGIVARMCGVHQQTLRNYERWELVTPQRSSGGTRLYSNRDVQLIQQILRWKEEFGLNLAGIEVMSKLLNRIDRLESHVQDLTVEVVKLREGQTKLPG